LEEIMKTKRAMKNEKGAKSTKLSFKREKIRALSDAESRIVVGGATCRASCGIETCPVLSDETTGW
jgi:hypothetical protein